MFAKDFNLLNEIYNHRIFKESTETGDLGTEAYSKGSYDVANALTKITRGGIRKKQCLNCKQEANECQCKDQPPAEDDIVLADKPVHSGYDDRERSAEYDEEGARMAKQELYRIAKMAYMLHDIICDREELAPWLADKISRAYEGLNSVFAYKDYEKFREELESGMQVEEGTERDLFKSLDHGGINIINQIKKAIRSESKETVEKVLVECISVLEAKKK